MKTFDLAAAGTILRKDYQQIRNLLMKRGMLRSNPKPCISQEDLEILCQEHGLPLVLQDPVQDEKKIDLGKMMAKTALVEYLPLLNGLVDTPKALFLAIAQGHYTSRAIGGVSRYLIKEFKEPDSWMGSEEAHLNAVMKVLDKVNPFDPATKAVKINDEQARKAAALLSEYVILLKAKRIGVMPPTAVELAAVLEKIHNAPWSIIEKYLPEGTKVL